MKKDILKDETEELAAGQFLKFYNSTFTTEYCVVEHAEGPDFRCRDSATGAQLLFDVTTASEPPHDPMIRRKMLERTYSHDPRRRPATQDMERALPYYKRNIEQKLLMRYGANCALVVYHLAPIPIGNLEHYLRRLRREIDYTKGQFDKGVWFLHWHDVYRLDKEDAEPAA